MTKIALWLLSTVSVLVLLFGYHTSLSGPMATGSTTSVFSGTASAAPSTAASMSPSTSSSGSSAKATTTSTAAARTVTGAVAQTQWGEVQVAITITGDKITAVSVPVAPDGNPRDAEINDTALPILIKETLAAQSASVDMVSGATVTSSGYLTSLQSALDQADL